MAKSTPSRRVPHRDTVHDDQRRRDAIEFYKEAFGATEIFRWADPDGRVRHAEVVIGDSPVMLTDEAPSSV